MDQRREDIRICLLYEFKLGRSAKVALKNVERAFGEKCTSLMSVKKWYTRFQSGDEFVENRMGWTVIDDNALEKMLWDNPYISNAELARYFGVHSATIARHLRNIVYGGKIVSPGTETRQVIALLSLFFAVI
ncbi:hypothetical protein TELCIR_14740 [Teladorsagia circumcincta]|uniref:Mos1 transposase HTH domain-containing protein n=1 Tax=Teladorsagia circumcincta TaxID=45464 RepID=A0A2G9U096_TELCI|nr:hypothetical protein TELCIR_14740 [Teladorsagia circumcincta]